MRQGRLGGFRPAEVNPNPNPNPKPNPKPNPNQDQGAALRCYHKATEVAAHLLEP